MGTNAIVHLIDAQQLEFTIKSSTTGSELIHLCAEKLGLREIWYFGLEFVDTKGQTNWLKLSKKVMSNKINKKEIKLRFLVKYFPESVSELIQDITKKLFYYHVRDEIISQRMFCPQEHKVMLESCDQIDRKLEYLQIAETLDNWGVKFYHDFKYKNGNRLSIGVHTRGLGIYENFNPSPTSSQQHKPTKFYQFDEITNISFNDRKLNIKFVDKMAQDLLLFSTGLKVNKNIFVYSMGCHELYMRRRVKVPELEEEIKKIRAEETFGNPTQT